MKALLLALIGLLTIFSDRRPYDALIKRWAGLFHLKIRYYNRYTTRFEVDIVDDEMFISKYNKAVHDKKEYLYSLAHEFGHLIDAAYQEYYDEENYYDRLLNKHSIYEDEVQAWKIGKVLLQEAKVYEAKSFNKLKTRCLKEYREVLNIDE